MLLVGNQMLRSSSRPKKVPSRHLDLLVLCRHFRDLTSKASGDNAQRLRKSISIAKDARVHSYQLWACEWHFLSCYHVLKLVCPDMQAEAILSLCISGRQHWPRFPSSTESTWGCDFAGCFLKPLEIIRYFSALDREKEQVGGEKKKLGLASC